MRGKIILHVPASKRQLEIVNWIIARGKNQITILLVEG